MKKFPKLLILLLSAIFALSSVTACSDIGETLDTLGDVANIAAEVLDEIDSNENASEINETEEVSNTISETESDEEKSETELNEEDSSENITEKEQDEPNSEESTIKEDGSYTSKEDVALYIHIYGKLPENFITKDEARSLGWEGGGLDGYADGKCIGGDRFGNYEGLLPKANGRTYTECDIDTLGKDSRGAKRIVFSNDGLIYYTDDHYESFELLYGEE